MRGLAEIVKLRTGDCRDAVGAIAPIAAGEAGVDDRSAAHVEECLRCQAELAAYRRLLRHLRGMRHDAIVPPDDNLTALVAALEAAALEPSPNSTARVVAYVGGITVATAAAGAAGMLVWMSRRRVGLSHAG